MRPVVECSELVEGDVTDVSAAFIVVGDGNVAGDAVPRGFDARGELPVVSCIAGVGDMRIVLKSGNNLLRVCRIDGDGRLSEEAGFGRDGGDLRLRCLQESLRKRDRKS